MKYIFPFLLLLGIISCQSSYEDSTFPTIDLNKDYPTKRIDIHEIADVEYIPLETNEQSLIGNTDFQAISDKYIIIGDMKYFQIIIFDRQGKFIRCINKRGQGPGEYISFYAFDVDFDKEEIFIMTLYPRQTMWVYSFEGNFLREFKYDVNKKKLDIKRLNNYNDDYLIAYNDVYWPSPYPEYKREADKTPYYLINKQTGAIKIAHDRLFIPNPVPPYLDRMRQGPYGGYNWTVGYTIEFMARNGKTEFLLVDNSLDTLYTFENHQLQPAIVRTPSITGMKEKRFVSPCALTDSLFIYRRVILEDDLFEQENTFYDDRKFPAYIFNRNTGEINQVEIYDSNISTELTLSEHFLTGFPGNGRFYSSTEKNQVVSSYYLHHLDGVIDKEQCKGKFKEVYGKTHEEDNPILIIYTFK